MTESEPADNSAPPPRRRRQLFGLAFTDLALLALPVLLVYWALATQSGLRAVAAAAQWAVPALQIEVASGSLVDTPRLARLVHEHRAGGHSGRHSARRLLPGLAAVAAVADPARGAGDTRVRA